MSESLHFIDFPEEPGPPRAAAPERRDVWTQEADVAIDALRLQMDSLTRRRRRDRGIGVALAGLLIIYFVVAADATNVIVGFLVCLLAASWYMPVRGGPTRRALERIKAKLAVIDPPCPACGYALRHLTRRRCPECGRRVRLPTREEIEHVVAGGPVTVEQPSMAAESGWIALLLMLLAAVVCGRVWGVLVGWWAAAVPAMTLLVSQVVQRYRQSLRVPPYAACDACGESTSLLAIRCEHCDAPLLAEHVYVKPGLRGRFDPRLNCLWAQLSGGTCVCGILIVAGLLHSNAVSGSTFDEFWGLQAGLLVIGLILLTYDLRLTSAHRLKEFDKTAQPLCHRCRQSLAGAPANGRCDSCGCTYSAIDLAGGRPGKRLMKMPPTSETQASAGRSRPA